MTQEQLQQIATDPRAFLGRCYRATEKIAAKRERIEHWQQVAESVTSTLKPVVSFGSLPSKKVETCVCNIIELQEEIKEEIQELITAQQDISRAIKELVSDHNLQTILELRYVNYVRWEEIAVRMNYAYRWVMRLHNRALDKIKQQATTIHAETAYNSKVDIRG